MQSIFKQYADDINVGDHVALDDGTEGIVAVIEVRPYAYGRIMQYLITARTLPGNDGKHYTMSDEWYIPAQIVG